MKEIKKISVFNILISFIVIALIIGIYVNNSIRINRVSTDCNLIKEEIKNMVQTNDALRIEIEKLCSFNRISEIVGNKMGMKYDDKAFGTEYIKINKSDLK